MERVEMETLLDFTSGQLDFSVGDNLALFFLPVFSKLHPFWKQLGWLEGPRDINLELIAEACRKLQDEEPYLQL